MGWTKSIPHPVLWIFVSLYLYLNLFRERQGWWWWWWWWEKKNEGLGTRGQWSESHAVVKTCLCINSFKDATPYLWQRALAMRDHPKKILVVLYIPRPYIPRVSFVYRMLILSRMATCCLFFGKSCHSQTHGESNPTHHSCLLLENLFVNYNLLFPSRCNRIPHARNKIKVKLKIK